MEFLCYHRDRPGSAALRDGLGETHWSYMDRFERELIARGPTLAADGETATGSIHVVDVRDAAAARSFAFEEPLYQAGAFRDVLVRRWRNAQAARCGRRPPCAATIPDSCSWASARARPSISSYRRTRTR